MPSDPPSWSDDELLAGSVESRRLFREERTQEPLEQYLERYDDCESLVEDVLEASIDLSILHDSAYDLLVDNWENIDAIRYLAAPPISMADLAEIVDSVISPTQLARDPGLARRIVEAVFLGLDRERFPWVAERRDPTVAETRTAIVATTSLLAAQRVQTFRRNAAKNTQEDLVKDRLRSDGFLEVDPRAISNISLAPSEGTFCAESPVAGRKADVVVRLWDGRVMPIECKVSNSSTNSVKRLNNDAAAKAVTWLSKFGTSNIVPAAVISGVYKTHNLKSAQSDGLTIFWAHDLAKMTDFIESTRP